MRGWEAECGAENYSEKATMNRPPGIHGGPALSPRGLRRWEGAGPLSPRRRGPRPGAVCGVLRVLRGAFNRG